MQLAKLSREGLYLANTMSVVDRVVLVVTHSSPDSSAALYFSAEDWTYRRDCEGQRRVRESKGKGEVGEGSGGPIG